MSTPNTITNPQFIEKQVEKLQNFQKNNPAKQEEPSAPAVEKDSIRKAVEELTNIQRGIKKTEGGSGKAEERKTEEESQEAGIKNQEGEEKEVVEIPKLEKVDLDKNKKEVKKDEEVDGHLKWLTEDEEEKETKKEPKPNYEEEIKTYKSKVSEYENLLNDDYIKAVVEFRKNGGVDLNELSSRLGIVDPAKITIEDFYKQEAASQGLSGDTLNEAVEEAVESYKALPKLTQAKILNEFKNNLNIQTEEKLKSFSVNTQKQREQYEAIQNSAIAEIEKEVKEKVGKKWRGLLIDEKMSKEIQNIAPTYALPITDDNGRVVGYDTKHGVEMAIYAKFGKKLLKAQYDLAKVSALDEVIEERNRPSENMTSNQIVVSAPNDIERATKEWRDEKRKQGLRTTGK